MSETFPPPVPPAYKVGVKYALPAKTWVTGRNGTGLWGLPEHKHHVITILADPVKADTQYSNAGYRQSVACITCQIPIIAPVDGEFLQERVTDEYLNDAIEELDYIITIAKRARRRIAKEMLT